MAAIVIRDSMESLQGRLRVDLIYNALKEVEDRDEQLGPMACKAVTESIKICTSCIAGAFDEKDDEDGTVKANQLLRLQAILIKKNRGAFATAVGEVGQVITAFRASSAATIAGVALSYSWSQFSKALFTLSSVATGSLGGAVSTLAALKDVRTLLPDNASWSDYIKFAVYSKQPLIGDSSEIVKSILEHLAQDPTSVFYQPLQPLQPIQQASSELAAIAPSQVGFLGGLLEGSKNLIGSAAKAAGELVKTGAKVVYQHELEIMENQVNQYKEEQMVAIKYATRSIQTSLGTIYRARDITLSVITPLIVIFLIMILYIVYKTCLNERLYAAYRRQQRQAAQDIKDTMRELNLVMNSTSSSSSRSRSRSQSRSLSRSKSRSRSKSLRLEKQ